jgi:hypothetical protein
MRMRYAKVTVPEGTNPAGYAETITNYLPLGGNYQVARIVSGDPAWVLIAGEDNAGWTLDEYVIPRLWSGLIRADEITETQARQRDVQEPTRGSGKVACCGGHRERCLFGRPHTWSRPWFEDGRVQRLATTYHCHQCDGVCTAEENDCHRCGANISGAPVTQPEDPLRRHWCSSGCRDAAFEDAPRQAHIAESGR